MKNMPFPAFFLTSFFTSFSQSSVWEVEKNGAKIYTGGTVHILRNICYELMARNHNSPK